MSKKLYRPEKRLLPFLLALFLGLCHFVAVNAHYAPPFHFNSASIDHINLSCGDSRARKVISDREQINQVVKLLNQFSYREKEGFPPAYGWAYGIDFTAGIKEVSIVFGPNYIRIYKDDASSAIYYGPPEHFRPLVDMLNRERDTLIG